MNAAEDRLSALMDAATSALDPPIDSILAAGESLGRARKRRRRVAVAAGTAAVVMLAGAGVLAGMHGTDPDQDYDAAGHVAGSPRPIAASGAPSSVATPAVSPTFAIPLRKPGEVPINATAAVNILRKLVAMNWKFGSYLPTAPDSLLRVNVDDGGGLAQVTVNVTAVAKFGTDQLDCAKLGFSNGATPSASPNLSGGSKSECYTEGLGNDNAVLEVLAPSSSKVVIDRVIAYRSDGVAVEITAQNGVPDSGINGVTREWPPLDVSKWGLVALNPMWQLYVPAILEK